MKFFGLNHNQSNGSYAFVTLSNGFLYNLVTFEVKLTHPRVSDRFLTQVSQFVSDFVTFEVKPIQLCDF